MLGDEVWGAVVASTTRERGRRPTASTGSTTRPSSLRSVANSRARYRETTSACGSSRRPTWRRRGSSGTSHEGVQQHPRAHTEAPDRARRRRRGAGDRQAPRRRPGGGGGGEDRLRGAARSLYPTCSPSAGRGGAAGTDGEGLDAGRLLELPRRGSARWRRRRLLRRRRHARHRAQQRRRRDDRRQGRPAGRGSTRRRLARAAAGAHGACRGDRRPARGRGTGRARRAPARALVGQTVGEGCPLQGWQALHDVTRGCPIVTKSLQNGENLGT